MQNVFLVQREKNIQSMLDLGITLDDVKTMCMALVPQDWQVGPVPDDGGKPGDVWVFHPTYKGIKMYLKVRLVTQEGTDYLTIISCHQEGLV